MLETACLFALMILFLHSLTWDDMIFDGIKKIIKPEWNISKPIYGCPICMSPWYGLVFFFIFYGFEANWKEIAMVVLATGGLGVISVLLIDIKDSLTPNETENEKE